MKIAFLIIALLFSKTSVAEIAPSETIWCTYLKAGCLTEREKKEIREECRKFYFSKATYQKYLREAYEYHDPKNFIGLTNWEAGGYESAQDYALKSMRSLYLMCVKGRGFTR